jgi:energy-coupling factor transporter transmembrane protein EcfT
MGEDDRSSFISRIGTFFLLIGIVVVILFIASDIGAQTYFSYFFIGVILLALGWYFKRISAPPASQGKRFEGIRTLQQKNRESAAKREAEKNDKSKKK